MRFIGTEFEEDKPISMIITTLAARLYQNQGDVYSTLKNIVYRLAAYSVLLQPEISFAEDTLNSNLISKRPDGTWYIPNPVNLAENFADRWHENGNRKAKAFFQWIEWVNNDLLDVLAQNDFRQISKSLENAMGEKLVKKALGYSATPQSIYTPTIDIKPSKPWGL